MNRVYYFAAPVHLPDGLMPVDSLVLNGVSSEKGAAGGGLSVATESRSYELPPGTIAREAGEPRPSKSEVELPTWRARGLNMHGLD